MKVAKFKINKNELEITFIRSPGPGGQNVNKVASGVLLRFNILKSSLPSQIKERLSLLNQSKVNSQGELIFKATRYRTQLLNKQDALNRLQVLIDIASTIPRIRKKTKPTKTSVKNRLEKKKIQAKTKLLRQKKSNFPD